MAKFDEVTERSECRRHVVIVCDIVAMIQAWTRIKRQQPKAIYAKLRDIVEPLRKPLEVAYPVAIAVFVSSKGETIDDGVLVPQV